MKSTDENFNRNKPIGIYDSGVGGLSVLHEIKRLLPNENFIYYGDLKNSPYGTKSQQEIMKLSLNCGDFLYKKNVKSIIIACNTATSVVVQTMREKYNMPVFSMEPAVKPAVELNEEGLIVVLATPATLAQKRYDALLTRLNVHERVKNIACPELVELVENNLADSPQTQEYLSNIFEPLRDEKNICAIVLGCTHYSFAQHSIEKAAKLYLNGKCRIFDGRFGTARYVREYLISNNLTAERNYLGKIEFFSSLQDDADDSLMNFYLGHSL